MLRTKGFREVVAGAKGIHIVADLPGGAAPVRWRWRPATASMSRGGKVLASRGVSSPIQIGAGEGEGAATWGGWERVY